MSSVVVTKVFIFSIVHLIVVISLIQVKLVWVHGQMMVHEKLMLQRALLRLVSRWLLSLNRWRMHAVLVKWIGGANWLIATILSSLNLTIQARCLLNKLVHRSFQPADIFEKGGCSLWSLCSQLSRVLAQPLLFLALSWLSLRRGSLGCSSRWLTLRGHVDLITEWLGRVWIVEKERAGLLQIIRSDLKRNHCIISRVAHLKKHVKRISIYFKLFCGRLYLWSWRLDNSDLGCLRSLSHGHWLITTTGGSRLLRGLRWHLFLCIWLWAQNCVILSFSWVTYVLYRSFQVIVEVFKCSTASIFREPHLDHTLQMFCIYNNIWARSSSTGSWAIHQMTKKCLC